MKLPAHQKSNIRHFIYYLVNGTLNFTIIRETFGDSYHHSLKTNPDLFYKTACIYIDQETNPNYNTISNSRLGSFICRLYQNPTDLNDFQDWEIDFTTDKPTFSSDFKNFTKWFITANTVDSISFHDYIDDGATFVEQCFAIWTNVVTLENNTVTNYQYAISRVEEYIKSYYINNYPDNLEDWECELY
ncbi:DUF7677 family protein [Flavobacterium cerinum]|uniref:DUF7677 domain-containing protein n=1 Tax=Flavobacterium cerinum TaxID=2502784 RepID=A0ABY5IX87_9FLAO|nr:hypothetical protein [Flavobacterium cerinum]UUC45964.1 hypothetical protein NOX80_01875 [Flavobacterium cerinum]